MGTHRGSGHLSEWERDWRKILEMYLEKWVNVKEACFWGRNRKGLGSGRGYEISLGKGISKCTESRDIQKCPFGGQWGVWSVWSTELKEKSGFMGRCDQFNLNMQSLYIYKSPRWRNLRVWNSSKTMTENIHWGVLNNWKSRSYLEKCNHKDGWTDDCGHRSMYFSLVVEVE